MMMIGNHGGMCCGIKHIFELGSDPQMLISGISPRLNGAPPNDDINYTYHSVGINFFKGSAPKETYEERFNRYLDYLRIHRPHGIVETSIITLMNGGFFSQEKWLPIFDAAGFKEVTPEGGVYNSNSGNKVRVFHLYM
jgi:hypothetical protein